MSGEREDSITLDESAEIDWMHYLSDFKRDVYPVFSNHGIDFGTAFVIWMLNRIDNSVSRLHQLLDEEQE